MLQLRVGVTGLQGMLYPIVLQFRDYRIDSNIIIIDHC